MNNKQILTELITMHNAINDYQVIEIEKLTKEVNDLKEQIRLRDIKPIGQLYPTDVIAYTVGYMYGNPGKKIQAIKAVRDRFGYGLKESKDLVDALSTPNDYVEYRV